jgi:hypothetical protein
VRAIVDDIAPRPQSRADYMSGGAGFSGTMPKERQAKGDSFTKKKARHDCPFCRC